MPFSPTTVTVYRAVQRGATQLAYGLLAKLLDLPPAKVRAALHELVQHELVQRPRSWRKVPGWEPVPGRTMIYAPGVGWLAHETCNPVPA